MSRDPEPAETAVERPALVRAVPNLLTTIRLALGFAFPLIPPAARWAALIAAAATEFLDGQLARLLRLQSSTGRILDPVADKVFVVSVLATLAWERTLAPWQLFLVASRDVIVTAGALWVALRRGPSALRRMPPSLTGKAATASQFLFLLAAVATREVNPVLLLITSALSLAAGLGYLLRFR